MALEDKYEGLQRLVQMGKEKGYVLYDEVSEVLPGDVPGGTELTLIHEGLPTATDRQNNGVGWNGALNKLARYVKGEKP